MTADTPGGRSTSEDGLREKVEAILVELLTKHVYNYDVRSATDKILAIIDSDHKALAEKLGELTKSIERECYWCEDCNQEIAVGDTEELHKEAMAQHEVVRITVFGGWQRHVLNNLSAALEGARSTDAQSKGEDA